ncbi:protein of unknown function (plasmid) [Paraburkholderia dioscoreae]|uniref:Uncharacterized protein n=1 Tax=Paraburkholderia dioscoreae TaxID=2604047 RepID=A0A5Q4YWP5_9BURK|nr:protein of unknown function [Paraburkholderia dioscoreae]
MSSDSTIQSMPARKSPSERGKFLTFFLAVLLLVFCFWSKPMFTLGFDPQSERCLPDLHLALLVHKPPRSVHDGDLRSAEKSGRQHSVELRNGGTDEANPQGCVHEGIS